MAMEKAMGYGTDEDESDDPDGSDDPDDPDDDPDEDENEELELINQLRHCINKLQLLSPH